MATNEHLLNRCSSAGVPNCLLLAADMKVPYEMRTANLDEVKPFLDSQKGELAAITAVSRGLSTGL